MASLWPWCLVLVVAVACGDAGTGDGPDGAPDRRDAGAADGGGAGGDGGAPPDAGGTEPDASPDTPDAAAPFVPEPIPVISAEPPALCDDPSPAGYFQFLDDTCAAKVYPSHLDRDHACPSVDPSAIVPLTGGGTATYRPSSEAVVIEDVLGGLVPADLDVTVILVRRVGGVPHYRYLSNGSATTAYQPWSTTKFLAVANAAATLRIQSTYGVGLTASVDGIALGDLVTSVHNYDSSPYSSNSLGRYFHNIGGRARANDLIHDLWLGRPAGETFGGNYGEAAPALGYTFVEDGGASVTITPDATSGPANHLASFTTAEALKRLVLHREEAGQRLPGIQWADLRTLLYGAPGSSKGDWGGMSADTAIYLQSGHDWDYIERRSKGRWRVFSKLGLGSGGQFLDVGYACLPVLDDDLQPVPGWGREVIIAAHLPTGGASWAERDRILARAYRAILIRVVDGSL